MGIGNHHLEWGNYRTIWLRGCSCSFLRFAEEAPMVTPVTQTEIWRRGLTIQSETSARDMEESGDIMIRELGGREDCDIREP